MAPLPKKLGAFIAGICLVVSGGPLVYAQADDLVLPKPGTMVNGGPTFQPPILKGIKIHPDNPFCFDFLLDPGNNRLSPEEIKSESQKLVKYFLAGLTVPDKDLWVNLSPYEKDRIIAPGFALTEMGRDLLAEDYILKQLTATLIYPGDRIGKTFWKKVYEQAVRKFGTTNIPVNTFNKVWIVPQKAVVYENGKTGAAYVVESRLQVMLEEDYLSLSRHSKEAQTAEEPKGVLRSFAGAQDDRAHALGSQMIRAIVIPELDKEVNEDKNFSRLRQVYNSLILAKWYKQKVKDSILSKIYTDRNKIAGLGFHDALDKKEIYKSYLQSFKKGVFNFIKEEPDDVSKEPMARKFFSGGVRFDLAMVTTTTQLPVGDGPKSEIDVRIDLSPAKDKAMAGGQFIGYFVTDQQKQAFFEQLASGRFDEKWNDGHIHVFYLNGTSKVGGSQSGVNTATYKNPEVPGENFVYTANRNDEGTDIYLSSRQAAENFRFMRHKGALAEFIIYYRKAIDTFIQEGENQQVALRLADHRARKEHPQLMRLFSILLRLPKGYGDKFVDDIYNELKQALAISQNRPPSLLVYGSARFEVPAAERHGELFAKRGYAGINGYGTGAMWSSSMGFFKGRKDHEKGSDVGLPLDKINFLEAQGGDLFAFVLLHNRFFSRKYIFPRLGVFMANAYLGGVGTLDEIFEILTFKEKGEIDANMPMNLIGKKNYDYLHAAIEDLDKRGLLRLKAEKLANFLSDDPSEDQHILSMFESYVESLKAQGRQSIFRPDVGPIDPEGIKKELIDIREQLGALGPTIAVFGQEQKNGSHPEYKTMARQLGYQAAMDGYSILVDLNHGSLGIAVQEGFRQARQETLSKAKDFFPELVDISHEPATPQGEGEIYLHIRNSLVSFVVASMFPDQGSVYFPCGIEGLGDWFSQLDSIQVGKLRPTRQILIGHEFWDRWRMILEEYVHRWKTISAWTMDLSVGVDSVKEAMSVLDGQNDKKWLYNWDRFQNFNALADFVGKQRTRLLETREIPVFEGTVRFIQNIQRHNQASSSKIRMGVSSTNPLTRVMLDHDNLLPYFDAIVDGRTVAQRGIPFKPSPKFFQTVASDLRVNPEHTVVFEDAVPGVQSAVQGGFGLVIGVNRGGNSKLLKAAGAHLVVDDIRNISLEQIKTMLLERVNSDKVQGIIFDDDGVIMDTVPLYFELVRGLLNDYFEYLSQNYGIVKPADLAWEDYAKFFRGRHIPTAMQRFLLEKGIDFTVFGPKTGEIKALVSRLKAQHPSSNYKEFNDSLTPDERARFDDLMKQNLESLFAKVDVFLNGLEPNLDRGYFSFKALIRAIHRSKEDETYMGQWLYRKLADAVKKRASIELDDLKKQLKEALRAELAANVSRYYKKVEIPDQGTDGHKDPAMKPQDLGGIDLTFDKIILEIQNNNTKGIAWHIDPVTFKKLQAVSGFSPVITHIQSVRNLRVFLESGFNIAPPSDRSLLTTPGSRP